MQKRVLKSFGLRNIHLLSDKKLIPRLFYTSLVVVYKLQITPFSHFLDGRALFFFLDNRTFLKPHHVSQTQPRKVCTLVMPGGIFYLTVYG